MLFLGNEILLVKISSDSFENKPIKAYTNSAEYELFADESELVLPNSRKVISTGIRMSIPKGYYAEIKPRSGLARNGIVAFNGTVDSGYLGLIYVLIFNFSDEEFFIRKGNRIAQIIFKKCETVCFSNTQILFDTERGINGFGSSGL